jgi:hypothetical protein
MSAPSQGWAEVLSLGGEPLLSELVEKEKRRRRATGRRSRAVSWSNSRIMGPGTCSTWLTTLLGFGVVVVVGEGGVPVGGGVGLGPVGGRSASGLVVGERATLRAITTGSVRCAGR